MLFGDYLNSAASVLDPIFFPHHANIDRKFLAWQLHHQDLATSHYAYPSRQPTGHRLHDLCGPPDDPMTDDAGVPMTNAQVLAEAPDYSYDTLRGEEESIMVDCLEGLAARCAPALAEDDFAIQDRARRRYSACVYTYKYNPAPDTPPSTPTSSPSPAPLARRGASRR